MPAPEQHAEEQDGPSRGTLDSDARAVLPAHSEASAEPVAAGTAACAGPLVVPWKTTLLWLLILAILHVGLAAPRLTRVPRVIMDESWEAITGWSLAFDGRLRNPVIPNREGIDRAFIQPRVTQSIVLAGVYRLLGFSLMNGRIASVLVGLVAAWGVYSLVRVWASPGVAGLAGVLFIVDSQIFLTTRVVRPEIYLACASIWMLALLARGITRGSLRTCFAAGLVGGVGCYTHPNMAFTVIPALPLIFCHLRFSRRAWATLLCYGLGGFLAVLPFVAWVGYAQIHWGVSFKAELGSWYLEPLGSVGQVARREFHRWWGYLRLPHRGPWVLVVAASMVAGLLRRHPLHLWGWVQIAGHAVLFSFLVRKSSPHYLVVLSPWLAAFVALWLGQLWAAARTAGAGVVRRRGLQAVAIGSVAVTLAIHLAGNLLLLQRYRDADYDGVCQRIAAQMPPGSRIHGNLVFWTGLHRHPYSSEIAEWFVPEAEATERLRARLNSFDPQYIICSSDTCWTLGGLGPRRTEIACDPRRALGDDARWEAQVNLCRESFIWERRAVLVDAFDTYDFGKVKIYRVPARLGS